MSALDELAVQLECMALVVDAQADIEGNAAAAALGDFLTDDARDLLARMPLKTQEAVLALRVAVALSDLRGAVAHRIEIVGEL